MIGQAIRAQAWKWAAIGCAVLAVAAVICFLVADARAARSGARADAAEQRAEALAGQVKALKEAEIRAVVADKATNVALSNMDKAAAETNERLARMEGRIHDRAPVPAVCPDPDPALSAELQDGRDRVHTAARELRSLRGPEGAGAP